MNMPAGPFASLAAQVRAKREASELSAELLQLQKTLRQHTEKLLPKIPKKRLAGLLLDASEEAGRLGEELRQ
jgi:predicted negative regulator of RcsB-dependent stress response